MVVRSERFVKEQRFKRAYPDAFRAVRATVLHDRDMRLFKIDRVLGTDADATTAKVAGVRKYLYQEHDNRFVLFDGKI